MSSTKDEHLRGEIVSLHKLYSKWIDDCEDDVARVVWQARRRLEDVMNHNEIEIPNSKQSFGGEIIDGLAE